MFEDLLAMTGTILAGAVVAGAVERFPRSAAAPAWWSRERVGEYLPAVSVAACTDGDLPPVGA
jgi:hypothetical protein